MAWFIKTQSCLHIATYCMSELQRLILWLSHKILCSLKQMWPCVTNVLLFLSIRESFHTTQSINVVMFITGPVSQVTDNMILDNHRNASVRNTHPLYVSLLSCQCVLNLCDCAAVCRKHQIVGPKGESGFTEGSSLQPFTFLPRHVHTVSLCCNHREWQC